jgi:hypothetical protein
MKTDFGEAESAVVSLRPSGPDVPRPAPRAGTRGVFARHGHGAWARHYRRFRPRCGADAVGRLCWAWTGPEALGSGLALRTARVPTPG